MKKIQRSRKQRSALSLMRYRTKCLLADMQDQLERLTEYRRQGGKTLSTATLFENTLSDFSRLNRYTLRYTDFWIFDNIERYLCNGR